MDSEDIDEESLKKRYGEAIAKADKQAQASNQNQTPVQAFLKKVTA